MSLPAPRSDLLLAARGALEASLVTHGLDAPTVTAICDATCPLIGSAIEIPLLLYILHRRAKDFSENRARLRALDSTDPLTGLTVTPVLRLRKIDCPDDYGRLQKLDALTLDFDYEGALVPADVPLVDPNADADGDGVRNADDCALSDASAWSVPGAATALMPVMPPALPSLV